MRAEISRFLIATIATHEGERQGLLDELAKLQRQAGQHKAVRQYTEADVRRLLRLLSESLLAPADAESLDEKKAALGGFLSKIVLDPSDDVFHIHYRIGVADTGVNVATLRGFEPNPVAPETVVVWKTTARILTAKNAYSGSVR